jgi:hypothetical protein
MLVGGVTVDRALLWPFLPDCVEQVVVNTDLSVSHKMKFRRSAGTISQHLMLEETPQKAEILAGSPFLWCRQSEEHIVLVARVLETWGHF